MDYLYRQLKQTAIDTLTINQQNILNRPRAVSHKTSDGSVKKSNILLQWILNPSVFLCRIAYPTGLLFHEQEQRRKRQVTRFVTVMIGKSA